MGTVSGTVGGGAGPTAHRAGRSTAKGHRHGQSQFPNHRRQWRVLRGSLPFRDGPRSCPAERRHPVVGLDRQPRVGGEAVTLQVKTGTQSHRVYTRKPENNDWLWDTSFKAMHLADESHWYAFVHLDDWPSQRDRHPEVLFVPSREVAKAIRQQHDAGWKRPFFIMEESEADLYRGLTGCASSPERCVGRLGALCHERPSKATQRSAVSYRTLPCFMISRGRKSPSFSRRRSDFGAKKRCRRRGGDDSVWFTVQCCCLPLAARGRRPRAGAWTTAPVSRAVSSKATSSAP
jgi:hypothetical protein